MATQDDRKGSSGQHPVFYAVNRGEAGWQFSRRDFITLAGAATAGAALACGRSDDSTPQIIVTDAIAATSTRRPTTTPRPTATPEPTAVPLSPEEIAAARRETCTEIMAHQTEVNRIEASPDGRIMHTVASYYTEHKLWSLPGGVHYLTFSGDEKIWFNPAGGQVYLYSGAMEVVIFDTITGNEITIMEGEPLDRYAEAFSPDGSLIVLHIDETLVISSTSDGEIVADFVLDAMPTAALITSDNARLVVGDEAGKITVIDLETVSELASWQAMETPIRSLYLAEEESVLAVVGQESAILSYWSFPGGALMRQLQGSGEVVRFAFLHPSENVLSSYDDSLAFYFWSLPEGQLLGTFPSESVVGYLPECDYIVTGELEGENYSLVNLESMETVASYPVTPERTNNNIWMSPDNRYFAEAVDGITLLIRSLADGEVLFRLEGHTCEISVVNFTRDAAYVISGDFCGGVNIWSLEDGAFLGCAIDLTIVDPDIDLNQYDVTLPGGGTVTYTLPCGAPIPAGAVCTCNCVGGGGCSCVGHTSGGSSGGGHYWFPN